MNITDIINLNAYPEDDIADPERSPMCNRWQQDLANQLYCVIPNFVTTAALKAMAQEAQNLQTRAYHNNSLRNCYLHQQQDTTLPPDHARNLQDRSSVRMIAYDQLNPSSPLKIFYQSKWVRQLVASIVNEGPLYLNEDPYQPANYVCYQDDDESSWHFDEDNSFTMTLMIQPAEQGGAFEMSPNTRSDTDQNYDQVQCVLTGNCKEQVVSINRDAGELCIFKGSHSLHRVTKVIGDTPRIMGVFVYEFSPGQTGDSRVNATIYGPRVAPLE